MQMVHSVTHDINPTNAFFTVQNALRKSITLDDITCTTLYRIKKNRNTICKIRTEINLHPHGDVHFFFTKYTTLGAFFLTCPARTSLKYYKKNYGQNFPYVLKNCTVFTATIFSNVTCDQRQSV